MAITASKPAINIREKLAELDQPQGIKGTEVLRADTADEARNAIGARGRKNLIINGGFDVWQRGTSGTTPSSGYGQYDSADRWASYYNGTALSKQSSTINGSLSNSLKAIWSYVNIFLYTKVENGSSIINGKEVTLSFYAKSSTSSRLRVRFRFFDSAAETNSVTHDIETDSSNLLNTVWTKYSYTTTATDSLVNTTRDLAVLFDIVAGSSGDDIEIAQVQLELGNQATEFEHRSYGEELALCQRYYQRHASNTSSYPIGGHGYIYAATKVAIGKDLVTSMRGVPAIYMGDLVIRGGNTAGINSNSAITSIGTINSALDNSSITFTATCGSATLEVGQLATVCNALSNDGDYIAFDAEL